MKKADIYLLTGPIRSGKTTSLKSWIEGRDGVYGLLSPDQGQGRSFLNIHNGEEWAMEARSEHPSDLTIGRFRFSKAAFDTANAVLMDSISKSPRWIIVDEVGPLELNHSGLRKSIDEMVNQLQSGGAEYSIIWVVRDSLLQKVEMEWDFHFKMLTKDDLDHLA